MPIRFAELEPEIENCFPVMQQLRPHLTREAFLQAVRRQIEEDNYRLVYLEDGGQVRAVAGFRINQMLSRGRFLYVDDLVTDAAARSQGYGKQLLNWLVNYAREQGCQRLDLDSGAQRSGAHRFYFREGMYISAYHFALDLRDDGVEER